jgi:hypothetical protein
MYAMASSLRETAKVIQRVSHTLNELSAILSVSFPYICEGAEHLFKFCERRKTGPSGDPVFGDIDWRDCLDGNTRNAHFQFARLTRPAHCQPNKAT